MSTSALAHPKGLSKLASNPFGATNSWTITNPLQILPNSQNQTKSKKKQKQKKKKKKKKTKKEF